MMGRGKMPMQYIKNFKARNASFKKRKQGVMKKISELSILCDIDACMIMYGPDNRDGMPLELRTWAPAGKKVDSIIQRWELRRNESRDTNLADFFGNQTCKLKDRIGKARREAAKTKFGKMNEFELERMGVENLQALLAVVEQKMERVASCIDAEKEKQRRMIGKGQGALEMVKFSESHGHSSSDQIQTTTDPNSIIEANDYYNAQAYWDYLSAQAQAKAQANEVYNNLDANQFRTKQDQMPLSIPVVPYIEHPASYPADMMPTFDYTALLTVDDRGGYPGETQFQSPDYAGAQYFQPDTYISDPTKSCGLGYSMASPYLATQQHQHSVLSPIMPKNFQAGCFQSSDCFCNLCLWQQGNNKR